MKKRLREIIIWGIAFAGLDMLYRNRCRKAGPLVRVLCLHDVPDRQWFADFIALLEQQYHIISPTDYRTAQFDEDKINVLLTFDDGYQSWVDNCLPVLTKKGITAVFFINSGLLDAHGTDEVRDVYVPRRLRLSPKQTLSWEGAAMLVAAGQEIGGHTVGHHDLTTLFEAEVKTEIMADKRQIETRLGVELRWFAYPFGQPEHYTPEITALAMTVYEKTFAGHAGFAGVANTGAVPRLCLPRDQSLLTISRWLNGSYDVFARLSSLIT